MSEVDMDSEDFLEIVWGKRVGWVDLPAKIVGNWIPYYTEWDGNGCGTSITRRIDTCLRDHEDLYFSVAQFSDRRREYENFLPTSWLWADLDEVTPADCDRAGFPPTIAWQSSKGRYQALWTLDRKLGARAHDPLNQSLSYAVGADRGGWDLTQVLRVPGTRNWTHDDAPTIRIVRYDPRQRYDAKGLWVQVKKHYLGGGDANGRGRLGYSPSTRRRTVPVRIQRMLKAAPDQAVDGERSDQL